MELQEQEKREEEKENKGRETNYIYNDKGEGKMSPCWYGREMVWQTKRKEGRKEKKEQKLLRNWNLYLKVDILVRIIKWC